MAVPRVVASPGFYRAGIQMNEVRLRIITHTAAIQVDSQLAKVCRLASGNSYVYGASFHVQAFGGNAGAYFPQGRIGPR